MVVLPPDTQVMVPPVARSTAVSGWDEPPVLPPEHPLTVILPETFPVIVVHRIALEAHENFTSFNVVMDPSNPMQTSPVTIPGIKIPSPVSPVTDAVKLSAEGSELAFLT